MSLTSFGGGVAGRPGGSGAAPISGAVSSFFGTSANLSAVIDTTPNQFTFADQTNVALNSVITSAPVIISGITAPSTITVTGGTYSINSGPFTSANGLVNNGDSVVARHTSAGANLTSANTTINIGGVFDTFTSVTIPASIIYVDASNPTAGNGSLANPFKTIQAAHNAAIFGSLVQVAGGIYNEMVTVTTSGITFVGGGVYATESFPAIIDGQSTRFNGFLISGASNTTIDGFKGQNIVGPAFYTLGPNINTTEIRNCYAYNCGSSGIACWGTQFGTDPVPSNWRGIQGLLIHHNIVERCCNSNIGGGANEHITLANGVYNFKVYNNTIRVVDATGYAVGTGGEGIDCKEGCELGQVYNNRIFGLLKNPLYLDAGKSNTVAGGYTRPGFIKNIHVYQNLIYNNVGHGITVTSEADFTLSATGVNGRKGGQINDIYIDYNTLFQNGNDGVLIYDRGLLNSGFNASNVPLADNIQVVNNISHLNAQGGNQAYTGIEWNHNWATNGLVKKNVTTGTNNGVRFLTGTPTITGNVPSDPLFTNQAILDFTLQATSPALNIGGDAVNTPAFDFTGAARVVGAAADCGAYERPSSSVTYTKNVALEQSSGMDGYLVWQSVFLLNDGRICSFGTGNHADDQSNAMRIIDPVTTPGTVQSYHDFPWTQAQGTEDNGGAFWNSQAAGQHGDNLYVSNFDNRPSMYIPSENKVLWTPLGVFDFGVKSWTYGNRSPNTLHWDDFIDISALPGWSGVYNPVTAWCSALDKGVWFGVSSGGSGNNFDGLAMIERNVAGAAKPWKLTNTNLGVAYRLGYARNSGACVGTDLYMGGVDWDGGTAGALKFFKVNLITKTVTASLATWDNTGEYFPQLVYDPDRQKLILIGKKLQEYNIATNVWTNITPSTWGAGFDTPMGVYHTTLKCIFFRGAADTSAGKGSVNFSWHKLTFPQTGVTRYSSITINSTLNPIKASKHVMTRWHPIRRRVYTIGGDYSTSPGNFPGQVDDGGILHTNDPAGSQSYARTSSLCNDMYSIDPYATGVVPWRLEHPYLPLNLGGVRESRMGRPDQVSMPWDSLRQKFWCFESVTRTSGFPMPSSGAPYDLWANGDMDPNTGEPIGTYSWAPSVNGLQGTWTFETSNRCNYRTEATRYIGGQLIIGLGSDRIGMFEYDPKNDVCALQTSGGTGTLLLVTFHPATKTYEYRQMGVAAYSYILSSTSYTAVVDGWLYATGIFRTPGGVRTSRMIRMNITAILAVPNQGTIPPSAVEFIQLPWSLSPGNIWENNGDAFANWEEHCGVLAIDRKVVLIKSYDHLFEDGVTKLAIWDPDTRLFTQGEASPDSGLAANTWCVLPETGEALFGYNTSGYNTNIMWKYRVR